MSGHHLPEVLMKKVDEYVDSLAPQIQPRVEAELETFQTKTIDSLEDQIVGAFRTLFNKDDNGSGKRGLDSGVPDSYGGQSLPFADEISKLTRSFSDLASGASDDLKDIFDLTEGGGGNNNDTRSRGGSGGGSDGFKTFLSAAVDVVQDQLEKKTGGGQKFELDGLLGVISNTVKEAARNPEEKARMITPEIKEKVAAEMREQHKPIAERFTKIALEHIKKWLRGNTTTRDLGEGARGEIEDQVKDLVKGLGGLFGSKKSHGEGQSRGLFSSSSGGDGSRAGAEGEDGHRGFSKIISEKLSTGLARVHREVRLEFRKILAEIEKKLFELLPDQFQKPLEKILGGNPFDEKLDRETGQRGIGDDIKSKLLYKIRDLIKKVQETLRESILGVVNGGHRKFERQSWVFVQNMVEQKVQKYLPKVKITVPDDIGDEGVSVGAPTNNIQLGGGHQNVPSALNKPPQTSYAPPPPQQGGKTSTPPPTQPSYAPPPQSSYPPPPAQNYPPPPPQNYSQQSPTSQQPQHQYPPQTQQQVYKPPSPTSASSPQSQNYHQTQYQQPSQQSYPPPPQQEQHSTGSSQHHYQPYRPPATELDSSPTQQQSSQQYYPPPPPGGPPSQQQNQGYNPQPYRPSSGGGEAQGYHNTGNNPPY